MQSEDPRGLLARSYEVAANVIGADVWADDALWARDFTLPSGTYPGAAIVLMYAMEATAHSWACAKA
jgi:hypothetical protein